MVNTGSKGKDQNTFGYRPRLGCSFLTCLDPAGFQLQRKSIGIVSKSGCTHLFLVFQSVSKGKSETTSILEFLGGLAFRPIQAMGRSELANGILKTLYARASIPVQGLSQSRESKHYESDYISNEFLLGDRDRECRYLFRPDKKIQANHLFSRLCISFFLVTFLGQGYGSLKGDWNFANPLIVHLVNFDGF
jgi:hypothetical protein